MDEKLLTRIRAALDQPVRHADAFYFCPPTELMIQLGFEKLPLYITMRHLRNVVHAPDPNDPAWHGVPVDVLAGLPEDLDDPILVFAGHSGAYVFLIDKYINGVPIVAVINPAGHAVIGGKEHLANFLLSVYSMEKIADVIARLHDTDIVCAHRPRARTLLAKMGIPFSHLADKLTGPGVFAGQIKKKGSRTMRDIAIGDAIYSVVKIQDLERRFVVVDVDELHNLKAVPLCQNVQDSEMFAFRKRSGLKQVAADLGTEVSMSAAWPWIKQPLHFSDTEMKELEQKREEYGKDHQITMIAADEPVEHLPDFDQGILDLYNSFQEDPARIKEYLEFSTRFYGYSQRNRMLIYMQNQGATFVASKRGWAEKGYKVLPEQERRGIYVYRPVERECFERRGRLVPVAEATEQERQRILDGSLKVIQQTNFVRYPVWDISQTTCPVEQYPQIYDQGYESIDHALLYQAVERVAKLEGISVTKESLTSISIGGYYSRADNSIHINSLARDTEAASTILHEYAHALLHCGSAATLPKEVKEFEAQGTAVMLLQHYGLTVTAKDQEYLVTYLGRATALKEFDIAQSLARMGQQYCHAMKRIDEQQQYVEKQQRSMQPEQPGMAQLVQANFLKDL